MDGLANVVKYLGYSIVDQGTSYQLKSAAGTWTEPLTEVELLDEIHSLLSLDIRAMFEVARYLNDNEGKDWISERCPREYSHCTYVTTINPRGSLEKAISIGMTYTYMAGSQ